jgi:hypothetical protein
MGPKIAACTLRTAAFMLLINADHELFVSSVLYVGKMPIAPRDQKASVINHLNIVFGSDIA